MRKYKLNENYFEKIDSKDKAYFLGLLFADGCNAISRTQKHCSIIISLQEQDKEILQKFMNIVSPNKPLQLINNINGQKQYRFVINSKKWSNDLIKLGCVPNKSLVLQFPTEKQVPKELQSHFIRGYFDGDGCVWNGKRKIMWVKDSRNKNGGRMRIVHNVKFHFTGCLKLLEDLRTILFMNAHTTFVKISGPRKNKAFAVRMLEYSGRGNLKKFYDYIYNNCEDLYIKRKKEKFEEIFCAFDEKSSNETGLIAGTPEMAISSQASIEEGSSTIPEMEVESSDSKCPALSK